MKKLLLINKFAVIVISILVLSYFIYCTTSANKAFYNLEFYGKIENIIINEKGFKSILLNSKWIYLSNYGNGVTMDIGDSITKKKLTNVINIYKLNTNGNYYLINTKP